MNEETKFHWTEAITFAAEGIKSLMLLNGVGAISILTFLGNMKLHSNAMVGATCCFALGAGSAFLAYGLAYKTQLEYGNAIREPDPNKSETKWKSANNWHGRVYWALSIGALFFVGGVLGAACGLWS